MTKMSQVHLSVMEKWRRFYSWLLTVVVASAIMLFVGSNTLKTRSKPPDVNDPLLAFVKASPMW